MGDPTGEEHGGWARAWSALGRDGATVLDSVEVVRVDLPFLTPVATAVGTHRHRPLVLVHLVGHRRDGTPVEGWGECAALADTTYDAEDVDGASRTLAGEFLPSLVAAAGRTWRPAAGRAPWAPCSVRPAARWPSPRSRWPWGTPTSGRRAGRSPICSA